MKLKARPHLHYAPVPGGVYVSSAHQEFVVKGPPVLFEAVDVCLPLLAGGADEDDLVEALGSPRARPLVQHLTAALREHDMLIDGRDLTVGAPSPQVRERYAEVLTRLEAVSSDPYAAFARLQAATVALIGPSETITPAARGLTRAGVGHVVVADADDPAAYSGADAVIHCSADGQADQFGQNLLAAGDLGPTPVVVPVLLGERVLIAGPAVPDAQARTAWSAFGQRVQAWAQTGAEGPVARPLGDALIGALAGHLLVEVLTGTATPGAAHVVHGSRLSAEQVVVGGAVTTGSGASAAARLADEVPHRLALDKHAQVDGDDEDEDEGSSLALAQRWTGMLEPAPGEQKLPQVPLALRAVQSRTGTSAGTSAGTGAGAQGTVVEWGTDQVSGSHAVALEVLRRSSGGPGVSAAGSDERRWLLDGALRLLAEQAQPLETVTRAQVGVETDRIWRRLEVLQPGAVELRLRHVEGIDWRLAQLVQASTGQVLARAWAPNGDQAAQAVVSTALAISQARQLGHDGAVSSLSTHTLMDADDSVVDSLHKQVLAEGETTGWVPRGWGRSTDVVLGDIPYWFGPVTAHSALGGPRHDR